MHGERSGSEAHGLRNRLATLEQLSGPLAPDVAERRAATEQAVEYAEGFLSELSSRPVYQPPGDLHEALNAFAVTEDAATVEDALSLIDSHVSNLGHALGSDRFFAYVPSGGLYVSALADYIAAVINRYSGVGHAGPGAARLEQSLIRWLASEVGYPESAEGDLTSGGSMSTLSAVVTARESADIRSRDVESAVVYVTSQTHHTFSKILRVAGLGDCVMRNVATDDSLRMDTEDLQRAVEADRQAGLRPFLVAASAGTTDVGAVDPLDAIAEIAKVNDIWMHVDGAYGGTFMLCEEGRSRLAGIEKSDSLVLNPHKGFFLPCGSGVVLIREGNKLHEAFRARGVYMQDMETDPERSACDISIELTRPFRGLRLWLPLKLFGIAPFRAALEEKLLLAQYFHDRMAQEENCEMGPGPDLSVATFRYLPPEGDVNEFNRRLVDAIRDDGRIFVTSTTIDGRFTIRMAILGYNTHLNSVDTAIEVITETAARLMAG